MPLRINLLAEDMLAEEMRRKDPVKRAYWIAGFCLFLMLLWAMTMYLKVLIAKNELKNVEARWSVISADVKKSETARTDAGDMEKRLSALNQFATNRFLWGNALNAFQMVSVENVHFSRIRSMQTFPRIELPPPPNTKLPPSYLAIEKNSISVEGRDYSVRAAEQVPKFKEAIQFYPWFTNRLDTSNTVQLISLSAPQPAQPGSGRGGFVFFELLLNFKEKEHQLK